MKNVFWMNTKTFRTSVTACFIALVVVLFATSVSSAQGFSPALQGMQSAGTQALMLGINNKAQLAAQEAQRKQVQVQQDIGKAAYDLQSGMLRAQHELRNSQLQAQLSRNPADTQRANQQYQQTVQQLQQRYQEEVRRAQGMR